MQKSERTFPSLLALPGQTAPGRVTVTRCRFALRPWAENENLPLFLNASYSPRGHSYGFPTRQSEFRTRQIAMFAVREGRLAGRIWQRCPEGLLSFVAMCAIRFRNGARAERNCIGGARKNCGNQKPSGDLAAGSSCGAGGLASRDRSAGIISAFRIPPWLP
jgi:hypothetical protein